MSTDVMPEGLAAWLEYIERLHPQSIAMGLERVLEVKARLALEPRYPIITVGGTNGKGSCCAMLETVLLRAGYRVGCYTSPHLLRYNERVRINGIPVDDGAFCEAFARIESARRGILLTYFEFGTLAAMLAFAEAGIDVAILEVGLGGRLDAVNAFDADCALVATVDLDHQGYLGNTREAIGFEKAGIFRGGRPAICADPNPPATLCAHAAAIGASLLLIGRDFGCTAGRDEWRYWGPGGDHRGLPYPALRGDYQLANAAACITALHCMRDRVAVAFQDIGASLPLVELAGRFELLPGRPTIILDVAHNPHAARALVANLGRIRESSRTLAVFGMLKDKDIAGVVAQLKSSVSQWFVASVEGPRAASGAQLAAHLEHAGVTVPVTVCEDIGSAWRAACNEATGDDRILAFGSFLTVAAVMRERQRGA